MLLLCFSFSFFSFCSSSSFFFFFFFFFLFFLFFFSFGLCRRRLRERLRRRRLISVFFFSSFSPEGGRLRGASGRAGPLPEPASCNGGGGGRRRGRNEEEGASSSSFLAGEVVSVAPGEASVQAALPGGQASGRSVAVEGGPGRGWRVGLAAQGFHRQAVGRREVSLQARERARGGRGDRGAGRERGRGRERRFEGEKDGETKKK